MRLFAPRPAVPRPPRTTGGVALDLALTAWAVAMAVLILSSR